MCVCCQELVFQPITTICSHNVCKVHVRYYTFKPLQEHPSLCGYPGFFFTLRLVSSGPSERRCTPAPPAVMTWARTMSWAKTRRFRFCSTSSFPATARADEVQHTFLTRIHNTHDPFCAPSYTVEYLRAPLWNALHSHKVTYPRANVNRIYSH